jgi:hypothetical protein
MSRPNNPGVPPGGPPRRVPGQEHQAQPAAWPPQQQPQGGAAWPPPQPQAYAPPPPQAPPADPYGAAGYHYPQGQPPADPYQQQHQPQPQAPLSPSRPASYAPQFERFSAPPQPQPPQQPSPQPAARAPMAPRAPEPAHDLGGAYHVAEDSHYAPPRMEQPRTAPPRMQPSAPPPPAAQRVADPHLRGTISDQWPATAPPGRATTAPPPSMHPEARNYDLSAYEPHGGLGEPPGLQSQRPSAGRAGDWPDQSPLQQAGRYAPQPGADQGLDLSGFGSPQASSPAGRAVVAEQNFEHEDNDYEDEPPRRSRGLMIVGALVGAIALGGGLAYGYKMFLGPPAAKGAPPVLKADKSPAKTQPSDPGGKQFAGREIKVMNGRLTDGGSEAASSSAGEDGVRRVQTMAVTPQGSLATPPPQPAGPPGAVAMPGVYVVDPLRRGPPQPSPQQQQLVSQAPPAPPQVSIQPQTPPQAPRVVSLPPPRQEVAPPTAAPVTPVAKAPPPRVATATTGVATDAPPPPPVRKTAVAPAAGGGGSYVAVLASQRSSTEALARFADLQQKYSALQGRTPLVQEANLGEKGIYYRLVVPAGPKDQASALCTQLKASGHSDCWIKTQ